MLNIWLTTVTVIMPLFQSLEHTFVCWSFFFYFYLCISYKMVLSLPIHSYLTSTFLQRSLGIQTMAWIVKLFLLV
jgi:hypothetical protein